MPRTEYAARRWAASMNGSSPCLPSVRRYCLEGNTRDPLHRSRPFTLAESLLLFRPRECSRRSPGVAFAHTRERPGMPLFIDRLPFHSWTDRTRTPAQRHWSVVLSVFVTDRGLPAPAAGAVVQEWLLDTGSRGEGFAWRHHLVAAGLDPDVHQDPTRVAVTTAATGTKVTHPVRRANFWLVSNLPALQNSPLRMAIEPGIPFRDVPTLPDPNLHRLRSGLRVLRRAQLRIELDCAHDTVSIWTPDPPAPQP